MSDFDIEKLRSIGHLSKGRTKDHVKEYRDKDDGHLIKETTNEIGTTVTQHDTPDDRQDVMVRPQTVHMEAEVKL